MLFQTHFWVAVFCLTFTLILSASYTLWMYKRVFFGPPGNKYVEAFPDITWTEKLNYILLAILGRVFHRPVSAADY